MALLAVVVGVVWSVWKVGQIDRTALDLPAVASGAPQNYLIVGSDDRAPSTEVPAGGTAVAGPVEGQRSDTILVLRIAPDEQRATMLSLPRDLWVTIADTGERQRINTAFSRGEQVLVDTITAELDIPIHHFVEVDFNGFQGLVEAVGGVPVYFDRAMRDDRSGLDVGHPGCITLDPTQALALARSRHLEYMEDGEWHTDPTGDLGRITRQQEFVRHAVRRAVGKGIRNPLVLKRLVDIGVGNITVDDGLSGRDLLALGRRFAQFDADSLETFTLPADPDRTDGGADILRLRADEAQGVLDRFRDEPAPPPPSALAAPAGQRVAVYNATAVTGLAAETAASLEQLGYEVTATGNAGDATPTLGGRTVVRHGAGGTGAAEGLGARLLGATAVTVEDVALAADELVLIVGDGFEGIAGADGAPLEPGAEVALPTTTTSTTVATSGDSPTSTAPIGRTPGTAPPGETCG